MPSDTAAYSHFSLSRTLRSLFLLKLLILLGFCGYVLPSRGVAQPGSASDEIIEKSMPYAKVK